MAATDFISADRLRELLAYDADTGLFTWKQDRGGRKFAGVVAGSENPKGYIEITVDGGRYWAHRLAWFYVHGVWPLEIDHANGLRADNRIDNLRDVPHRVNAHNKSLISTRNATGATGVWRHKNGRFGAGIVAGATREHLGYFSTVEEAAAAYQDAKKRLHAPSLRA